MLPPDVRHVHVLAPDVEYVGIVHRQRDGRGPHETELEAVRGPANRRLGPDLDVLHQLRAPIVTRDDPAHRPGPRPAAPHQVPVDGVRYRPTTLAPANAHGA